MGERSSFRSPITSSPPGASWCREPQSKGLMRLLRAEGILPVPSDEPLAEDAVLIRLPNVEGATVRWVVLYDPILHEERLCDALCACVLEFLSVAGADEGGVLNG